MKLKKIASLMLAGIMAVSMLTACGNTVSEKPEDPTDEPTVTPSTSASAQTLVSNMSKDAQNKVTAVSNGDLDAALQSAVEDYFSNADVVKYGKVFEIPAYGYGWDADARDTDIGEALVGKLNAFTDVIGDLNASNMAQKTDALTAVEVYGVNGSVTDKDVLEQLGHKITESVENLNTEYDYNVSGSQHVQQYIDYDYEVSVSIVTADGRVWGIEDTVKFVAVAVTRTGTVETGVANRI